MPIGVIAIERKGEPDVLLTEQQAKVYNRLVESGDKGNAARILKQCALDLSSGLQVPPGGASNAPIGDQAPKPGDEGQPDKSPANFSSSVVDSRPKTPKAGTPEAAEAAAAASSEDAEEAGKVEDKEPVPGEVDKDKEQLLKKLELE
jgi:hypothetical protein